MPENTIVTDAALLCSINNACKWTEDTVCHVLCVCVCVTGVSACLCAECIFVFSLIPILNARLSHLIGPY